MSAPAGFASAAPGTAPTIRRTYQPVRRNSPHVGEYERQRWQRENRFSRAENNARLKAAELLEKQTKKPGKRNGALGHIAIEVLRCLLRLRGKADGRLDPSLTWLAGELRRARSAVARALARLRQHGFLEWTRRSEPVEDPEPGGQYVKQATNAYFLRLSVARAAMVKKLARLGDSLTARRAEERAQHRAIHVLGVDRLAASAIAAIEDPGIRDVLLRMEATVNSQPVTSQGENPPKGLNQPLQDIE